jgi:Flp pilus assembly protein TadG
MQEIQNTGSDASGGGNGMLKIAIAVLALTALSLGGYYYYTKKEVVPAGKDAADAEASSETGKSEVKDKASVSTTSPAASSTSASTAATVEVVKQDMAKSKGVSPVRTDYDNMYNYQKRNGIWYSALKSNPNSWASWGIDSNFAKSKPEGWSQAVAALNTRYPND